MLSHCQLFYWQLPRRTSFVFQGFHLDQPWANNKGQRQRKRPPGTWAGRLIRISPGVPSGISWHLSSKLLFSWTNLVPQTVQLKWAHTVYLTPVKRRVKDFSVFWIEWEMKGEREVRTNKEEGKKMGCIQSKKNSFLEDQGILIFTYKPNAIRWRRKEKHHF